jgi:hypothetical protein
MRLSHDGEGDWMEPPPIPRIGKSPGFHRNDFLGDPNPAEMLILTAPSRHLPRWRFRSQFLFHLFLDRLVDTLVVRNDGYKQSRDGASETLVELFPWLKRWESPTRL